MNKYKLAYVKWIFATIKYLVIIWFLNKLGKTTNAIILLHNGENQTSKILLWL